MTKIKKNTTGSEQRTQTNEQAVEWAGCPEAVSC